MIEDTSTFWSRRILVSIHAIERARERLSWEGNDSELSTRVAADLRCNLVADRVSQVQPNWTHSTMVVEPVAGADFYCWDEQARWCWALALQRNGHLRVLTLLLDHDAYLDISDTAYIRSGMRRA